MDWVPMEAVREQLDKVTIYTATEEDRMMVHSATLEYLATRMPVADYREGYILPELVLHKPISLERVKGAEELLLRELLEV
jgi:hypothetical protein